MLNNCKIFSVVENAFLEISGFPAFWSLQNPQSSFLAFRYKLENLIFVCAFPGGKEKININNFLTPLVSELIKLKDRRSVSVKCGSKVIQVELEAYLILAALDLPASHKVGGFYGHGSLLGCMKCLQVFVSEESIATDIGYKKKRIGNINEFAFIESWSKSSFLSIYIFLQVEK